MATAPIDFEAMADSIIECHKALGITVERSIKELNSKRTKWYQLWVPKYIYRDETIPWNEYREIILFQLNVNYGHLI